MGTYPHYTGGVSNWCDMLVCGLPAVRFNLVSLVGDPSAKPVFELPENVSGLITVPLWGTGEVLELQRNLHLHQVLQRKHSATKNAINSFLPSWQRFINMLWQGTVHPEKMGQTLQEMATYFSTYDYDTTMRSAPVWDCFMEETRSGYPLLLEAYGLADEASLLDATDAMRLLYRWLTVLTVDLPQVDIIHAAAAGLCSLPGILARQAHGTTFLLTEHGIYLRERLLALTRLETSLFDQIFQARFDQMITETSYYYADQIAPGSNFNHRWELHNGAQAERIHTIYNGPDPKMFTPATAPRPEGTPPTIVWLGRIDPLKDLLTLIRAAAIVHDALPEVRFVLYGKAPKGNEEYYETCLALCAELDLKETVIFAGFAVSAEAAYNEGDFVVLSSISEGFPYSVVEAMMCGRTVVGTTVGGVSEALEGCGILVEPRNPEAMANACLYLLRNPDLIKTMGQEARTKAM
ncbi:MAG TPA: glycosyltransferase, partial [Chloroflexi bacterium]|nr:glycosyltransferase [Chloroflexota bacterium]